MNSAAQASVVLLSKLAVMTKVNKILKCLEPALEADFEQDAVLFDAQGNQSANSNAPLRPDDSVAVRLLLRKDALKVVFFRFNDIEMDYGLIRETFDGY